MAVCTGICQNKGDKNDFKKLSRVIPHQYLTNNSLLFYNCKRQIYYLKLSI